MISHPIESPCSPAKADIRSFLKKSSAARRALSELGPNDPKANVRMAESLITITAEQFRKKWNFDPISFRPMPSGRYIWTPVKAANAKKPRAPAETGFAYDEPAARSDDDALLEDRLSGFVSAPVDFISSTSTLLPTTTTTIMNFEGLEERLPTVLETAQPTVSPIQRTPKKSNNAKTCRSSPESSTPKTKQCKITAYGRQRKRLHSTSKTDEGAETEVVITTPRKRLALTPCKL